MPPSPAKIADRVFTSVMAPMVLGGVVSPAHPIGARAALALMAEGALPVDSELASRVDLVRIAVARKIAPIDRVDDPSGADWALGAALHDLLQVASPGWMIHASARRLLALVSATLERVAPVATAHEALMRHTWTSRVFALERRDATVSWWTGSHEYRGEEPPARLLAWPSVRRVSVARADRAITDLVAHGGVLELALPWNDVLARLLRATPLTDFATCARAVPRFAWSQESLAVVRSPVARTLALRAAAQGPDDAADAALGRATRVLLAAREWRDATDALDFLGHRALAAAQSSPSWPGSTGGVDDASFARAAGALIARKWIDEPSAALAQGERRRLGPILDVASRSAATQELQELTAPRTIA